MAAIVLIERFNIDLIPISCVAYQWSETFFNASPVNK